MAKRLRAARDLVCAFKEDVDRWVLTHAVLEAKFPSSGGCGPQSLEELFETGLPQIPVLAWAIERADETGESDLSAGVLSRLMSDSPTSRSKPRIQNRRNLNRVTGAKEVLKH